MSLPVSPCKEILLLCFQLQIHLVLHISGKLSILANSLSSYISPMNTEWELHQSVFHAITHLWDTPHLDRFASSLNHYLLNFVSQALDPKAIAFDVMSISWEELLLMPCLLFYV